MEIEMQPSTITKISTEEGNALDLLKGNIRIPFILMIKQKHEPIVRVVREDEMIFKPSSVGNILMGSHFSNNVAGEHVECNIFNAGELIELDEKLTFFKRLKIAFRVYLALKNY